MPFIEGVKRHWGNFAANTSIHGIGDFQKAATITRRIFWCILLIIAVGVAIWEINMVFEDYSNSPIITTYELVSQKRQQFPKIEICFPNTINRRQVEKLKITPVLVNYATLNLVDMAPFEHTVEYVMKKTGKIRASPGLFSVALKSNRKNAMRDMQSISDKNNLTYEMKMIGFAQVEAEIANTMGVKNTAAHFVLDTIEKMEKIQEIVQESNQVVQWEPRTNVERSTIRGRKSTQISKVTTKAVLSTSTPAMMTNDKETRTTIIRNATTNGTTRAMTTDNNSFVTTEAITTGEAQSTDMLTENTTVSLGTAGETLAMASTESSEHPTENNTTETENTMSDKITTNQTSSTTTTPTSTSSSSSTTTTETDPPMTTTTAQSTSTSSSTSTTLKQTDPPTTTIGTAQIVKLLVGAIGYINSAEQFFLQIGLPSDSTKEQIMQKIEDNQLLTAIGLTSGASEEQIIEALQAKIATDKVGKRKRRKRETLLSKFSKAGFNFLSMKNPYIGELANAFMSGKTDDSTVREIIRKMLEEYENTMVDIDVFTRHYPNVKKYVINEKTGDMDLEKFHHSVGLSAKDEYTTEVYDQRFGQCLLISVPYEQVVGGVGFQTIINNRATWAWKDIPIMKEGIFVRIDKEYNPMSLQSFQIPTKTAAQIGLQGTHYLLSQSEKYGRCQRDMQRNITSLAYSDYTCRFECGMAVLLEQCGCILSLPKRFIKPSFKYPSCAEVGRAACILKFDPFEDKRADVCAEQCKPPCEYWDYSPVVTYSKFPSYQQINFDAEVHDIDPDEYRSEILLDIAYSRMEYMKVEQKDAMSVHGFISQVGGQLGLFLGASALSIAQILVYCVFCSCDRKQKVTDEKYMPRKSIVYETNEEPTEVPKPAE